jgi:hypothetical protein
MRREETGCIDCTRDYCRTHRHTVRLLATAVRARTHGCSSSADDADHRARPRDSLHAPVLPFLCTVHRRNNAQCSGLSKILARSIDFGGSRRSQDQDPAACPAAASHAFYVVTRPAAQGRLASPPRSQNALLPPAKAHGPAGGVALCADGQPVRCGRRLLHLPARIHVGGGAYGC